MTVLRMCVSVLLGENIQLVSVYISLYHYTTSCHTHFFLPSHKENGTFVYKNLTAIEDKQMSVVYYLPLQTLMPTCKSTHLCSNCSDLRRLNCDREQAKKRGTKIKSQQCTENGWNVFCPPPFQLFHHFFAVLWVIRIICVPRRWWEYVVLASWPQMLLCEK